jgi:hypothetical protein
VFSLGSYLPFTYIEEKFLIKFNRVRGVLGAVLLAGACGLASGVMAAETATGVGEHVDLTIKSTKEAQAAAAAGNKEGCLAGIKQAKQHYKEITGAASGMPLQKAMAKMRTAQGECESGNTGKGAELLGEVVSDLQKIADTPR